ncbi:MAG: hypothetical protein V1487_02220 [bacterium]
MKYIEFRKLVTPPIFTSQTLKNLGAGYTPSQLTSWQAKGYLTKLRGGLYAYSDSLPELSSAMIACRLVTPSYLSLSFALSHHGIIPEAVFTATSITSKGTRSYQLAQGNFTYQHLPPQLFFGYTYIQDHPLPYNLADGEKALLDYFYLTPSIKNSKDLAELRLNLENIDWPKLQSYLAIFQHKRLDYLIRLLEEMYAHA